MDKIFVFSKVLDVLHEDGKDKLLFSAQQLIKAQKAVKVLSPKGKTMIQKSNKTM